MAVSDNSSPEHSIGGDIGEGTGDDDIGEGDGNIGEDNDDIGDNVDGGDGDIGEGDIGEDDDDIGDNVGGKGIGDGDISGVRQDTSDSDTLSAALAGDCVLNIIPPSLALQ